MPHQTEVEQNWSARGFSCDLWVDPPGQCWEGYVHGVDELVMVMEGRVEFEIDGAVHRPEPGAELFIPAGAAHSVRNRGQTTARWLYGYQRRGGSGL
ncbi:cupin domain-containing protein [Methylomagnum sp.]